MILVALHFKKIIKNIIIIKTVENPKIIPTVTFTSSFDKIAYIDKTIVITVVIPIA